MKRLTHKRIGDCLKSGYWSPNKKQELVDRLAEYENTGQDPEDFDCLNKLENDNTKRNMEEIDKRKWIPVAKRLPDEMVSVLAQFRQIIRNTNEVLYEYIHILYIEDGVWKSEMGIPNGKVIAWMPLPEAYKEE